MTARIEPLAPEQVPGATTLPGSSRPLNLFLTFAKNPALATAFTTLGAHLLRDGLVPAREREIVILRVGWRCRSVYEFSQHTVIGRSVGLTAAEVAAIASETGGGWSAADAALLLLADELCADDVVGDATWAALAQRFDEQALMELLVLAGYYRLVSGFLNSAGVELEPGAPGWPQP